MLVQGVLIDDPGSRNVDEDAVGLHQRQLATPDQSVGGARQGKRDDHDVGGAQQRIQILHLPDPVDGGIRAAGAVDRVHVRA